METDLDHGAPEAIEPEPVPVTSLTGALIGALLGLVWVALIALGSALFELPNPAFALFEGLTRIMPGDLITAGLELMIGTLQRFEVGDTAALGKTIESGAAYLTVLAGIAVLGALQVGMRQFGGWVASGAAAGLILGAAALVLQALMGFGAPGPLVGGGWLLALGLLWGFGLERSLRWVERAGSVETDYTRRSVLARIAVGSLAFSGVGALLARLAGETAEPVVTTGAGLDIGPTPTPEPSASGFSAVQGTRPEISALDEFYRVDITLTVPSPRDLTRSAQRTSRDAGREDIPDDDHFILVDGMFDNPRFFTLQEIRALPRVDRFLTLSCISNNVGGDLIDTQLFSGARLRDVLEMAGLQAEAHDIKFTSADGYTESLPVESAMDERTLLTYALGGQELTSEHGYPVRLFTPDRFGMKNPKWIVRIEAVPNDYRGYWENRGWSEQAFVKTTSVIDAVMPAGEGAVEAGGIAYAGARGIAGVELQLDQGEWLPASLNRPLTDLTWVLWRARVEGAPGRHQLTVRAIDGDGGVQTSQVSDSYPSGATGYHSRSIEIPGSA